MPRDKSLESIDGSDVNGGSDRSGQGDELEAAGALITRKKQLRAWRLTHGLCLGPETHYEHLTRSLAVLTWVFYTDVRRHSIVLEHHVLSGKRRIVVDGEQVLESRKFIDTGGKYKLTLEEKPCTVYIYDSAGSIGFSYALKVHGVMFKEYQADRRERTRLWRVVLELGGVAAAEAKRKKSKNKVVAAKCIEVVAVTKPGFGIFCDGERVEAQSEFIDDGSRHSWEFEGVPFAVEIRQGEMANLFEYVLCVEVDDGEVEVPCMDPDTVEPCVIAVPAPDGVGKGTALENEMD